MWGCGLAVMQSCQIHLGDLGLQKQVMSGKKLLQKKPPCSQSSAGLKTWYPSEVAGKGLMQGVDVLCHPQDFQSTEVL